VPARSERLLDSGASTARASPRLQPGARWTATCGTRRSVRGAPKVRLAALFGPQHGFRSDVQDNMIETRHGEDEIRRVPVYSLYSETREPTPEMLRDLDRAGDRSAGRRRAHLHLHLHDGQLPEGRAPPRREVSSAIVRIRLAACRWKVRCSRRASSRSWGCIPIPMRHGMTIGELARLFNEHFGIGANSRSFRWAAGGATCTST